MGAIGSLLAVKLLKTGNNVIGLCRHEHYNVIKNNGIVHEDINGLKELIKCDEKFKVFNNRRDLFNNINGENNIDWILITSKAYSLKDITKEYLNDIIKKITYPNINILLVQNGIGNEEILFKYVKNNYLNVYRAITTHGAYLFQPGFVKHTGIGDIKIGFPKINFSKSKYNKNNFSKEIKIKRELILPLIKEFNNSNLNSIFIDDIDLILWEKIFINVGINALASIYNIKNGELLNNEKYINIIEKAIIEAWLISKRLGIKVEENPKKYLNLTLDVAYKTANNINSMLQDLYKGRKTEIEFINGYISKYGKKLGISTPINDYLTNKIRKLEKSNKYKII